MFIEKHAFNSVGFSMPIFLEGKMKKDDDYLKKGRKKILSMLIDYDLPTCINGSLYQIIVAIYKQIEGYINSTKTEQEGEK